MSFLEELSWRGMLHDKTPGVEEVFNQGKVKAYIGFDPTAPSLTIGNYVQVMLLTLLKKHGHTPIVLMGGATGRIGDPSGKDKERDLKSYDELDKNLAFQIQQMKTLFGDDGEEIMIVNNLDFYKSMNVLDFLRDVGKTLTVNYMMSKDSVKNRLDSGLSFTEFSYQLLQSYDFQVLFDTYGCQVQMGGSDQWGNITSGTEFIRRNLDAKAYAVTTPLLTKSDGTKFGKSEKGNLWLDPSLTSQYQFYQFWLNADDADLDKYIKYFTLQPKENAEALINRIPTEPNEVKQALAQELTIRIHGKKAYEAALHVTKLLFSRDVDKSFLQACTVDVWTAFYNEVPSYTVLHDGGTINIADLLAVSTDILASKSEVRKAIQGNALSINKEKISSHEYMVSEDDWLSEGYLLIENGKKNKCIIKKG